MLAPLGPAIIPAIPGGITGFGTTGAGRAASVTPDSDPPTTPATSAPVTAATLPISVSSSRWLASRRTEPCDPVGVSRASACRRGAHLQDRSGGGCRPTLGGVVFG